MNKKKIILFIILTFLLNWLLVGVFDLLGGIYASTAGTVLGITYMLIPALVVVIVQRLIYHEPLVKPYNISFKLNRWFTLAWLLPVVISIIAFLLALLIPNVTFTAEMSGLFEQFKDTLTPEQYQQMVDSLKTMPVHPFFLSIFQVLIAGCTINALVAFGEELGWRGFLLQELKLIGFWKSSLFIGLIWGVWHAPLILHGHNYPQHPVVGVFMMIIWCILLSVVVNYITLKARSVIAAAVIHGSINASYGLSIMLIKGGNDLLVGLTGLAGFVALLIVIILLFIYDKHLAKERLM